MDFSYLDDWQDEEPVAEIQGPAEGYRDIWVLVETQEDTFHPAALEAMGQAREMSGQIGVYTIALLPGEVDPGIAEQLISFGADNVLACARLDLANYQPERLANFLASLVNEYRPEILLMAATVLGNDLAPKLAQRLDTGLLSHCVKLEMDMAERLLLGTFPVLGGEMYHTAACPGARPQMATLLPGSYPMPFPDDSHKGQVRAVDADTGAPTQDLTWIRMDAGLDLPAVPLASASVVVAGGRGMRDASGFALVEQLARALDGSVAGSRGAFDEGWISEDQIVGVGGTTVAPSLYIACGLSGDVYHTYSLQDADFVMAINSDEKAPIMKRANVAIVGDAQEVIPALLEELGH